MSLFTRFAELFKARRPPMAFAAPFGRPFDIGPGTPLSWWRDSPAEQVRQFQSWVYAAVTSVAQEVAKQRPILSDAAGEFGHDRTPLSASHPLAKLLARPNPWTTPWELWYSTAVYLELTGNCFWYAAPGDSELWVVPTHWVTVLPDAQQFVKGYEIRGGGPRAEFFSTEEIIHLKYPNPGDPHWGLSPLQANALAIDANSELLRSRQQLFRSGARPGVMLQTDQQLTDQTVARLEEKLSDKFAGRDNWHRPLVLEQGLKASPWTLTPAEMDFANSAKLTRDEILALFRVPAAVTGLSEHVGLGSGPWEGARTIFCEGTVQPKLELIAQVLTRDLAGRFGEGVRVEFADCSPRAMESQRARDADDIRLGVRTPAEVRRSRGLTDFDATRPSGESS